MGASHRRRLVALPRKDGSFSLFDVRVIGVWMAQEQRDSFASVLKNNRGDISACSAISASRLRPAAAQNLPVELLIFYALWNFGIGAQTRLRSSS